MRWNGIGIELQEARGGSILVSRWREEKGSVDYGQEEKENIDIRDRG